MAELNPDFYEPKPRYYHSAGSCIGQVIVWGGEASDDQSAADPDLWKLSSVLEQFDPCTELWCQRNTVGTPHLGHVLAVCTSSHDGNNLFFYGGCGSGGDLSSSMCGVLSRLDVKTLTWSLLCPETDGGPMKKYGFGMVIYHSNKLAVIGGYGYPTGPIQPGATFTVNTDYTDGSGWSNEFHVFDITSSQGNHSDIH